MTSSSSGRWWGPATGPHRPWSAAATGRRCSSRRCSTWCWRRSTGSAPAPRSRTVVSRAMRRGVSEEMVATLVDEHLRPLGLLKLADGSEPPLKRSNPLLGLKLKFAVTDPRTTRRLTDPFRFLFRPVPGHGRGPRLPGRHLVGLLRAGPGSGGVRRLPAAAAAAAGVRGDRALRRLPRVRARGGRPLQRRRPRRDGGRRLPGVAGVLHRRDRQLPAGTCGAASAPTWAACTSTPSWWCSPSAGGTPRGWDALLLLVATQTLQMVQQLLPLLRFDGYHLLADLAGVPDLYHRIRPTLLGLLPHRWSDPENRLLKPWARVVITAVGAGHDPDDGADAPGAGDGRAAPARHG